MNNKPKIILLIIIDSLRADRMSCYGYRLKTTPFLDSILSDFVKFEWAFSTCSYTLPSITSILTGKYPPEHYLGLFQTTSTSLEVIDFLGATFYYEKEIFIQEMLKVNGFTTGACWSTPIFIEKMGFSKGFDMYELPDKILSFYEVTRNLFSMMDRSKYPFFSVVHYCDVHIPYIYGYRKNIFRSEQYCKKRLKRGGITREGVIAESAILGDETSSTIYESSYDSAIFLVDGELGRIVRELKTKGLYEDSFIIITSDHGELLGEDNLFCSHVANLHPALVRVPLLIKFPSFAMVNNIQVDRIVSTKDIYYTILDTCNIKASKVSDEMSFLKLRDQKIISNKHLYAFHPLQKAIIRDNKDIVEVEVNSFYFPYIIRKLHGSFVYTAIWQYSKDTRTLRACNKRYNKFIKNDITYPYVSTIYEFIFLFAPILYVLFSLLGTTAMYSFMRKFVTSIKR